MRRSVFSIALLSAAIAVFPALAAAEPQGAGSGGVVGGTVTDPSGAVIAGATVHLENKVSGLDRTATTDATGAFRFLSIGANNYHLSTSAPGFKTDNQDVTVRNSVPVNLTITLTLGAETTSVDVHESTDLLESVPTPHTDIDKNLIETLPTYTVAGGLNDIVAHSAPGIVEDSNGLIHPQGDHAQTQFVFDNQPVTDQQSKQFSTSMPENAIASVEVISGAAPAEFGGKTSLVINAITKSGLGVDKPFGSAVAEYGSFGTISQSTTLGFGTKQWGEFLSANVVRSGRYLDPPEFSALHDKGNNQTIFNRFDFQPDDKDSLHLNLFASRAWFQTPNTYDQQTAGQDQRERILSYNIAPGWTRLINANSTFSFNPYIRSDQVFYKPSGNPFADQPATVSQNRRLTNLGMKSDYSWVNHRHNIKIGTQVQRTVLTERFSIGITDPNYVADNNAPGLAPYDLTRGGTLFRFRGHQYVDEMAVYAQDNLTFGGLTVQTGLRGDVYRGLSSGQAIEPRFGLSYLIKPSGTVLRASYSRFFETPYNENLILSSATGQGGLASNVFGAADKPLQPGTRQQYNVGLQQSIGKWILVDTGYFWKFTKNGYDFDALFNSPIAFPISWHRSKIDGANARISLAEFHGLTAYSVFGHTRARFFGPETGGLVFNSDLGNSVFRIDHDEAFEQTANVRYQPKKKGPWGALTWRYDSGQVAGAVPDIPSVLALSGDQQAAIGFFCGNTFAQVGAPILSCNSAQAGATRVRIPAPGTENDDTNPPRLAPRNLFDLAFGVDDLFHSEHRHYRLMVTAVNITNQVALYNFLSTFSGTHFVTPRGYTVEFGVNW